MHIQLGPARPPLGLVVIMQAAAADIKAPSSAPAAQAALGAADMVVGGYLGRATMKMVRLVKQIQAEAAAVGSQLEQAAVLES